MLDDQAAEIEEMLTQYMTDVDGNGEVNVYLEALVISESTTQTDPTLAQAQSTRCV